MAAPLVAAVPWLVGAGKGLLGMGVRGGAAKLAGAAAGAKGRAAIARFAGDRLAGLAGKGAGSAKQLSLFDDAVAAGKGLTPNQAANVKFLKDNYGVDVGGTVKDVMNRASGLNMSDNANLLERVKRGLSSTEGFSKNIGAPMSKDDIMMTIAPDLLFGGITAATTEGDLVDKALAGAGSTVGGIAGGLGARGILGPKSNLGILGTEMVGGIVGDSMGMGVANAAIRAKNGGMTPAEQNYYAQDEAYKQQIIDEFMAQNGLG